MNILSVSRVVVPTIHSGEHPLENEGFVAAIAIVKDLNFKRQIDIEIAIVDGRGKVINDRRIGRTGHNRVLRNTDQNRSLRVVDHHNLIKALPHISAGVNRGVGQHMVIIAPSRHHAVVDENSIH